VSNNHDRVSGWICNFTVGGDENEVETLLRRAVEIAANRQAESLHLRAATSLARLWQRQGKQAEARALLAPVYDWFDARQSFLPIDDSYFCRCCGCPSGSLLRASCSGK
jgi:hypothetical protein